MTTYTEIWKTLSAVNVNQHIKKKGNLSFLSWAWAWGQLMDNYPQAEFEMLCVKTLENKTVEVSCKVKIDECSRSMWLPVMDNKNKSIVNPTTRDISDAKMRCLVKCISLFGLGFYIYAGEDVPPEPEPEPLPTIDDAEIAELSKALDDAGVAPELLCKAFGITEIGELYKANYAAAIARCKASEKRKAK